MRPRLLIGRLLIKAGRLFRHFGVSIRRLGGYGGYAHPLALLVMRPDDLVELGRESYSRGDMVEHFCDKDLVDSGLNSDELSILDEIPLKRGKILLLGLGGGREAIHLSRLGFEVTGIDFVPEMIEKALKNAASRGLKIEGQVQEVSKLDLPECFYDIIWFASGMYSSVPMKKRRIEMLHKIKKSLRNKGYLVCSFSFNKAYGLASPLREFLKKILVFMTLGNFWYERGDKITGNSEFLHSFYSVDLLSSEFESGGFEMLKISLPEKPSSWSHALLKKRIPE